MRKTLVWLTALVFLFGGAEAFARGGSHGGHSSGGYGTGSNSHSHSVSGYTKSNGTYVAPYHATNPNSTQRDNYETKGNVNPWTGAVGTKPADH